MWPLGVVMLAMSSNYTLYSDMSHRVMLTLAEFGRAQEVYSMREREACLGVVRDHPDGPAHN